MRSEEHGIDKGCFHCLSGTVRKACVAAAIVDAAKDMQAWRLMVMVVMFDVNFFSLSAASQTSFNPRDLIGGKNHHSFHVEESQPQNTSAIILSTLNLGSILVLS